MRISNKQAFMLSHTGHWLANIEIFLNSDFDLKMKILYQTFSGETHTNIQVSMLSQTLLQGWF